MIKKLRVKFILVIMAIVMVLLGCILGVVIHFAAQGIRMQSISAMRAIATAPFQQSIGGKGTEDGTRLPFFTVQISGNGELISVRGDYFDLSNQDFLLQIIDTVLQSGEETGKLTDHDLRYLKSTSPRGTTIVFSDTTTEEATLKHLLYSCLMVFVVAMTAFLGISILLSRWAIKPVETAWNQQAPVSGRFFLR